MSSASPASLPALGETQFMSVGGTDLPLPYDARPDLAFEYTYDLPNATGQFGFALVVSGEFYETPLAVRAQIVTDGTVGARVIVFDVVQTSQAKRISSPLDGTVAPSTSAVLNWGVGTGNAYGPVGGRYYTPFPPVVAEGGDTMHLNTSVAAASGDAWTDVSLTVIRVPSGPARTASAPTLTPTLQLV